MFSLSKLSKITIIIGISNLLLWIPTIFYIVPNTISYNKIITLDSFPGLNFESNVKFASDIVAAGGLPIILSVIPILSFLFLTTTGIIVKEFSHNSYTVTSTISSLSKIKTKIKSSNIIINFFVILSLILIVLGLTTAGLVGIELFLYEGNKIPQILSIFTQSLSLPDTGYTILSISSIMDTVSQWVGAYGYAGVYMAMLIETIFPPIPSELVLPLAGYSAFNNGATIYDTIIVGVIATLGSTTGAVAIYILVRKMGRYAVSKFGKYIFLNQDKLEKIEKWFDKHGTRAVFLARMTPGMRELISIPAGLSKMNFIKYVIFTFAGSLIWSISLTLLGYFFGNKVLGQTDGSNNLSHIFNYVAIIVIVSLVGFIIYKLIQSKRLEP